MDFPKLLQSGAAKRLLEWHTGHGYGRVPGPLALSAISDDERLTPQSKIVWLALTGTDAVLSANGHSMELAAPKAVLARVEKMIVALNSGAPATVAHLLEGFSGRIRSSRAHARALLATLVSWRAVVCSRDRS